MSAPAPGAGLGGRWSVVTGASRGIGLGIAAGLAREGAHVVLVARDPATLDAARQEVAAGAAPGAEVRAAAADVADPGAIAALFDRLDDELPSLDVFVANAGFGRPVPFLDLSIDDWNEIVALNLTGTFLCCQRAARRMVAAPGGGDRSITVVSSIRALGARVGLSHYATTKAAVNQLVRSVALEMAPHRVRVNAVSPGLTRTPLATLDPEHFARREADIPLGSAVLPDEVAAAVLYLASPAARSVTGANLVIDGAESVC